MYKVVQIDVNDRPYLVYGSAGSFHAIILADFLDNCGIDYRGDLERPEIGGDGYNVLGMGISGVDVKNRMAYFSGHINDYMIGISSQHLDRIKDLELDWTLEMKDFNVQECQR